MGVDDRLPVRFVARVEDVAVGSALLIEGSLGEAALGEGALGGGGGTDAVAAWFDAGAATGHVFGCACCLPRGPAAAALSRLFLARARGEVAFFDAVAAICRTPQGEAAVRDALENDVVTRARFRLG